MHPAQIVNTTDI